MKRRRPHHLTRDGGLYAMGLAGIAYEIVIDHTERPTLLILLGAMVGLPSILKLDEKRSAPKEEPPPQEQPQKPEVHR